MIPRWLPLAALTVDLVVGEPTWLVHPAALMGRGGGSGWASVWSRNGQALASRGLAIAGERG